MIFDEYYLYTYTYVVSILDGDSNISIISIIREAIGCNDTIFQVSKVQVGGTFHTHIMSSQNSQSFMQWSGPLHALKLSKEVV